MMIDDPDAPVDMILMKDLYVLYNKYNSYANKPYSLNISQPVFLEEFAKACDVVITDPFVHPGTRAGKYNQNRISDAAAELIYVTRGDGKRSVLILWWWDPNEDNPAPGANTSVLFGNSFDKAAESDVDGIGGWNFSGSGNDLNSFTSDDPAKTQKIRALWSAIKSKNSGWQSPS